MKIDGLPTGWEVVRIAKPKKGEWFFSPYENAPSEAQFDFTGGQHLIIRKIPEPLQLREGAWYERRDGKVVGPLVAVTEGDHKFTADRCYYHCNGTGGCLGEHLEIIREVPPPKPAIDPGEGWRLLEKDELPQEGDECKGFACDWFPSENIGRKKSDRLFYRRRIAPKFRPFKNASEFMPHAMRWIRINDGNAFRNVFPCNVDDKVMNYMPWDWWLEHGTFIEDGTPCGVKE